MCIRDRDRYTLIISSEVTSFGDAGDRYTLIFSIKVTSFGDAGDRYTVRTHLYLVSK